MNVFEQIETQGISISLYDGRIKLEPMGKVTPAIVAGAKAHKAQILAALKAKSKNEPLRPYIQKVQKVQKAEKELKKDAFAPFVDIALRVQKVKTPEIIIKKMSNCLHGSRCSFISLIDDRQICSRNNKAIFDISTCPDGKWWAANQIKQNTQKKKTCLCCGGQTFWRKKNNRGGRWICEICHPPALSETEIERLQ